MTHLKCIGVALVMAAVPSGLMAQSKVAPLNDKSVAKYIEQLEPKPNELWRAIPWQVSLIKAQALAAKSQKPLFIWAMDGHPLACV